MMQLEESPNTFPLGLPLDDQAKAGQHACVPEHGLWAPAKLSQRPWALVAFTGAATTGTTGSEAGVTTVAPGPDTGTATAT